MRRLSPLRALRAGVDNATSSEDLRAVARQLREAVADATAGLLDLRATFKRTEGDLRVRRRQQAEAERRGRLARDVQDPETEEAASRLAAKHAEHVARLERQAGADRDAVAGAEREVEELLAELRRAERETPPTGAERNAERAWRTLRAGAGGRARSGGAPDGVAPGASERMPADQDPPGDPASISQ